MRVIYIEILLIFAIACSIHSLASSKPDANDHIRNERMQLDMIVQEDAKLEAPRLIQKYGYEVERHYVTTADGYIVQLHRITGGPESPSRPGKRVVYVMHGMLGSSQGFILTGPKQGLGYILCDNDYDVWLGNARGNIYSTNHTSLNPFGSKLSRRKFWSYTSHEIGYYDLPASINYILEKTGKSKLQYVGYSQGTTAFFIMASERPEYKNKIEKMHAIAPSAMISHLRSPPIRAVVPYLPVLQILRELTGVYFIKPNKKTLALTGELLCRDDAPTQIFCKNVISGLMGENSDQLNSTMLPVLIANGSGGGSTKLLIHYGQLTKLDRFQQFDYGPLQNLWNYGSVTPPQYNLRSINTSVVFYHAQNDWFVSPIDVHILANILPNVVKIHLVPHQTFNHIDFVLGIDAPKLVYAELLKQMKLPTF